MERLLRRKPVQALVAETAGDPKHGHLERSIGLFQLTMFGVGATIGTGIFIVLTTAVPKAGPGVVLAFAIAGITAALTALCYAELASTIPGVGLVVLLCLCHIGRGGRLLRRLVPAAGIRRLGVGDRRRLGAISQRGARRPVRLANAGRH
jgi:hypothetical protein